MKNKIKLQTLFTVLTGLLLMEFSGRAVTWTVGTLADNGPGSLRAWVALAQDGDQIAFNVKGVITLTGGEIFITRNVSIFGPGATYLTISGGNQSRIFNVVSNNTIATISGLTIADGLVQGASATTDTGSAGGDAWGGGIAINSSATLILQDCLVTRNRAVGGRGGSGRNSEVDGFAGGHGGNAYGGAIYNHGVLVLTNCTVSGNTAQGGDGGAGGGGNFGDGGNGGAGGFVEGGAIYNQGFCPLGSSSCYTWFVNSTISGNSALGGGGAPAGAGTYHGGNGGYGGNAFGGAFFDYGIGTGPELKIVNCTITTNWISGGNPGGGGTGSTPGSAGLIGVARGGGAYFDNAVSRSSLNTIFAGNFYVAGPFVGGPDAYGSLYSSGHNLIGKSDGSQGWGASDLKGTIATPLVARLGPLQPNGGQTPTHALLSGSPAIDAADDVVLSAPYSLSNDQRGRARRAGAHVDIGAYEFGASTQLLVTTNRDFGPGSLHDVIGLAGDGDSINFAPDIGGTILVYSNTPPDGQIINHSISINGPGAGALTVSAVGSRVFHILSGNVTICGLMISSGNAQLGGGIYNEGTLTLCDCYLLGNAATVGGGAIYNKYYATMTVRGCCFKANHSDYGGAIYSDVGASTFCINSTFTANSSGHWGGAIANYNGLVSLDSCTVAGNTAPAGGGGGGLFTDVDSGPSSVRNTILAANNAGAGPDSYGPVDSGGYNLVSRTDGWTQGFYAMGDRVGSLATPLDAKLGPLQFNSPTPTMALLAGSPAVDAGKSFGLATDQRGGRRPVDEPGTANASGGDGSDIGAYERNSMLAVRASLAFPTNGPQFMVICFPAEDGNSYQVQYSTDPNGNNWVNLGAPVQGHGLTECVQDTDVPAPSRFYRVQLLP
jgi:hypothetical protein